MANTDRPNGYKLVRGILGSPFNAQITECVIPTTPTNNNVATFIGDLVMIDTQGDASGRMTVERCSAVGDIIYGVIISFNYDETNLGRVHRPASTKLGCKVCTDPYAAYEVQDNAGATMTVADIGLNADSTFTTGNTTTGASGMELNSGTLNTTNGLQFHILSLVNRPDNAIGDWNRLLVRINQHQVANQVAGK